MKSLLCLLGGLGLLVSVSANAAAPLSDDVKGQQTARDALLIGLPLAAFGLTFLLKDHLQATPDSPLRFDGASGFDADTLIHLNGSPRHDLLLAMGRTVLATYALKYSVSEERPNGADSHSFPSGHTSVSFAGAEFIRKEYGWGWATPAYLAASYVGWSRVASDNHYTRDVVAGAAIGVLSNHDFGEFTGRYGTISITPAWIGNFTDDDRRPLADDALAPGIGLRVQMLFGN